MLRTLEGRAQLTVIALWIAAVAAIADAYAHVNRLREVQAAVDAQVGDVAILVPQDVIDRADTYVSITLVLSSVTLIGAAVLWIAWQYEAHRRLADTMTGWRAEARMSVIPWFVPVANLLVPVFVMAGLLRAAGRRATALLVGWWLAWVAAAVLAGFGTKNPEDLADQRVYDALAMVGDVVSLAAAVCAIGIVRALTDAVTTRQAPAAEVAEPDPSL